MDAASDINEKHNTTGS